MELSVRGPAPEHTLSDTELKPKGGTKLKQRIGSKSFCVSRGPVVPCAGSSDPTGARPCLVLEKGGAG